MQNPDRLEVRRFNAGLDYKVLSGVTNFSHSANKISPQTSENACKYRLMCMFEAPRVNHMKPARMG